MNRYFLCVFAIFLFVPCAWAEGFFVGLPDVPLIEGAVELEERGLSFDKPEGRILIAAAALDDSISDSQLQTYYSQALPEFGWEDIDGFSYKRGREMLEISVLDEDGLRILEVTISP